MPEVKVDLDASGRVVGARRGRQHREPPDHRGVHAGGQRGRGRDAARQGAAVSPPHPPVAQPGQDQGAEAVRPRAGPAGVEPAEPLRIAEAAATRWPGRPEQRAVHFAVLRSLQRAFYSPAGRRPLCPGQRLLLPLHLAHPPLSRPDRPPPAGRAARRPQAPQPTRTSWWCWASTAPIASSGPKRPNAS